MIVWKVVVELACHHVTDACSLILLKEARPAEHGCHSLRSQLSSRKRHKEQTQIEQETKLYERKTYIYESKEFTLFFQC